MIIISGIGWVDDFNPSQRCIDTALNIFYRKVRLVKLMTSNLSLGINFFVTRISLSKAKAFTDTTANPLALASVHMLQKIMNPKMLLCFCETVKISENVNVFPELPWFPTTVNLCQAAVDLSYIKHLYW